MDSIVTKGIGFLLAILYYNYSWNNIIVWLYAMLVQFCIDCPLKLMIRLGAYLQLSHYTVDFTLSETCVKVCILKQAFCNKLTCTQSHNNGSTVNFTCIQTLRVHGRQCMAHFRNKYLHGIHIILMPLCTIILLSCVTLC